nr:MAG TPA_asm: hypothetical protein [Bacteriophage sp.]
MGNAQIILRSASSSRLKYFTTFLTGCKAQCF